MNKCQALIKRLVWTIINHYHIKPLKHSVLRENYNRNVLPKESGNLLLGSQTGLPYSTTESNEVMSEMENGSTIDFKHQNFSYPDKKQSSSLKVG